MSARTPIPTRWIDRYSEPIGFVVLFLLALGVIALSAQRTTSLAESTLACQNRLAAEIREVREVTVDDLDLIEADCAALRRTK